jgi:hypothetical protein
MLEGFFIDRMEGNEEIFDRVMNDLAFRNLAAEHLMRDVYQRLCRSETRHIVEDAEVFGFAHSRQGNRVRRGLSGADSGARSPK